MHLHSPSFESRLRARVAATVRASPELRRQRGRAPKAPFSKTPAGRVATRLMFTVILLSGMVLAGTTQWPAEFQSAVAAVWFLYGALLVRARVWQTMYDVPVLTALTLLPAPGEVVVAWTRQRILRGSWGLVVDALGTMTVIVAMNDPETLAWLALVPLAALLALVTFALGLWLTFVPIPAVVYSVPWVAIFAGLFLRNWAPFRQAANWLVEQHSSTISLLLPTGWMPRLGLVAATGGSWEYLLLVLPAVGLILSARRAYHRLLAGYQPGPVALWNSFQTPPAEIKEQFDKFLEAQPGRAEARLAAEVVRTRDFLRPRLTPEGWIEGVVFHWLTPRERVVMELACGAFPRWTRNLLIGGAMMMVGVAGLPVARDLYANGGVALAGWTALAVGVIGIVLALPLGSGYRRYYHLINVGGINIPFGAMFPVSSKELARIATKARLVRAAFALPVFIAAGAVLGVVSQTSIVTTVMIALKILLLGTLASVFAQDISNTTGSNDTANVTLRSLGVILIVLVGAMGLLGFGIGFVASSMPWSALWLLLAVALSKGTGAAYAELHARRKFDLMTRPKQQ
jgi:hypothetical protein